MQARLAAIDTALSDMTLNDLQAQIDKELTGVTISEVSASSECGVAECGVELCGAVAGDYSPTYYDVDGEVMTEWQLARLVSILQHFAPLHLQACIIVGVEGLGYTAECGVAIASLDECGNDGT
jgi:orotate phosphoribosyltransferase-like protein